MMWSLPLREPWSRRQSGWAVLFLAALSFSLYAYSLGNGFVWDGEEVFLQDPSIRDLHYLPSYFTEGFFAHISSQGNTLAYLDYYRPAIKILHLLEYQLFGQNPTGYNVVNVLLNMAVVVVAFFVVRLITANPLLALIAAALYAVNPSRVEAVSWSYSDSYLVFSLFSLLSFWCFILRRYLLALAAFVVALLSQESAVLLPVVLLVYLWCYSDRHSLRSYLPVLPFLLLVPVFLLMRANAVGSVPMTDIGLWSWLNAAVTIVTASVKAFFVPDAAISIYHYRPGMFAEFSPRTILSYVVTLSLFALGVWLWRKQRDYLFWYLWFFIWITVIFNVGKYAEYYFMDKILYLASLGICVLLAKVVISLRWPDVLKVGVVSSALVVYFSLTFWRSTFYVSTPVYLEQAIQAAPDFVPLQYSLANVYQRQGENDRAIALFEKLVRSEPRHSFAQNNLGNLYYQRGDRRRALSAWKQAIDADPKNPQPYYNVAMTLEQLQEGSEALRYYMRYLQLEPRPSVEIQRHIRQFARSKER